MNPTLKSALTHLLLIAIGAGALAVIAQLANFDFGPYQALATVVLSMLADAAKNLMSKNALASKK